ncbi:zinc ribbon domain-containing protein [Desulfosporosinus fructosivorans]|uniref:Zinc ribbon domain-containing protein n=1 Tax=Desulfosporosinus fructosivorans TaxID=2018669 RepID=A0A4Z0R9Z1_9FIRM|nr:FmdB family zinc ribbon protein [Desulfosporosinus fructosivorans]TGE38907.1 zinc ribbon domain-containing protein [Desulfosporosinus fructosivorans]
MPIYEFGCPSCGILTTELYKMGENGELLTCGNCGHAGLTRQISGFASLGVSGGAGGGNCSPGCHGNCTGCH